MKKLMLLPKPICRANLSTVYLRVQFSIRAYSALSALIRFSTRLSSAMPVVRLPLLVTVSSSCIGNLDTRILFLYLNSS